SAGHVWCRHRGSLEEREAGRTSTGAHQYRAVHVHAWRDNVRLDFLQQGIADKRGTSTGKSRDDVGARSVSEELHLACSVDRDSFRASGYHRLSVRLGHHNSWYRGLAGCAVLTHSGGISQNVVVDNHSGSASILRIPDLRAERACS